MSEPRTKDVKSVSITWKGVSAYVKDKAILNDCSGFCRAGEMLAIMGPSGAGKTTLLSLLSKKNSPSLTTQGSILANNLTFTQRTFFNFGAFVYQNDLLFQTLTVRQTLEFAAKLKIQNKDEARNTVTKLLTEFQLQKCENVFVGGQNIKGISGGQKKRVCIAIEMVSKPSLIILDEPTSGLDSNKAAKVLVTLKKLAQKGHTIIFTLHQPSYLQYIKLDRLVLLNRGQTVYQGPANEIHIYMEKIGITVSKTSTISDFFMAQISQSKKLALNYETPLDKKNYELHLSQQVAKNIDKIGQENEDLNFSNIFMASFFYSFALLMKRDWTIFWRDKMKFGTCLLNAIMRFLLAGLLFINTIPSREEIALNPVICFIGIQGFAFNCTASSIMPAINTVALAIPFERQLYFKETDSKKYNPFPYFLSKMFIMFFGIEASTIIFCLTAYWITGWTIDALHFVRFFAIITLMTATGQALGFFCSTLFKVPGRVAALSNIVLIPMMVLSGLFNKYNAMASWIQWLQYISPFRYGFQLLMENQFGSQVYESIIFGRYDYRQDLGFTLSFAENHIVLAGITVFFFMASFLFLKFNTDKLSA